MRIAHIVTYVSVDGAFGGPLSVARSLASAQARAGHEVSLIAGWDGQEFRRSPELRWYLFPVRRLWKQGFSGLLSIRLLFFLLGGASRFDVVHVHVGRDLITLPASVIVLLRRVRLVVQTHGMVMPDSRRIARLLDQIATRRVLRRAAAVLTLTAAEEQGVRTVARGVVRQRRVTNGIEISGGARRVQRNNLEVLFLARLAERKRPALFASLAAQRSWPDGTSFVLVGPDEGELPAVQLILDGPLSAPLRYEGPLAPGDGLQRLAAADVFVLPSVGEVVPVTVLEAMVAGTPVVITEDCGLAPILLERGAAMVTGTDADSIGDGVYRVLTDESLRVSLREAGYLAVRELFDVDVVAADILDVYRPAGSDA